jgi:dephospho-CoA kinase
MSFSVIGVVGQAGHGKDTVANIIVDKFQFERIALADRLKQDLAEWFEGDEDFTIERQNARDRHPKVRRLQQIYGTEIRRAQDKNYWLKEFAFTALGRAAAGVRGVVVSDIRFPNEATILREKWNGLLLFVERSHQEANVDMSHASEAHVQDLRQLADYTFVNDGTLEDLEQRVTKATSLLLKNSSYRQGGGDLGTQNTGPEEGHQEVPNRPDH